MAGKNNFPTKQRSFRKYAEGFGRNWLSANSGNRVVAAQPNAAGNKKLRGRGRPLPEPVSTCVPWFWVVSCRAHGDGQTFWRPTAQSRFGGADLRTTLRRDVLGGGAPTGAG